MSKDTKTKETVYDTPPDLLHFVSLEHEQFLISLATEPTELKYINHIQGLCGAAISNVKLDKEENAIIYQLLGFTHYHFLFGTACLMRCHLSEAFNSLRTSVDAALVAAYIIHDRQSQVAYLSRQKPFDKLIRHYRNFLSRPNKLPHPHVPLLIEIHDTCSRFASHADVDAFTHRTRLIDEDKTRWVTTEYFQFSRKRAEREAYFLALIHGVVLTLDIFSEFLLKEEKKVSQEWVSELHNLGAHIETARAASINGA